MKNLIYLVVGVFSIIGAFFSLKKDQKRWVEEQRYGRGRFLVYLLEVCGGGLFNGFILLALIGLFFIALGLFA